MFVVWIDLRILIMLCGWMLSVFRFVIILESDDLFDILVKLILGFCVILVCVCGIIIVLFGENGFG